MNIEINEYYRSKLTLQYKNKNIEKAYLNSIFDFKETQYLFIMMLTFFLYILYIIIDFIILNEQELSLAVTFHLSMIGLWMYLIPSIYYNIFRKFAIVILHLMPIYAVVGTQFFSYHSNNPIYLAEMYVIIFWAAVGIGYMFVESVIVIILMMISGSLAIYFLDLLDFNNTMVYTLLMFDAAAIGILASYMIELFSRINYENKIKIEHMQDTKLASMGEMIQCIAHQWRQPLAKINSSVTVLDIEIDKNFSKNNEIEKKLTEIEILTEYMSETINDFQNFLSPNKQKGIFSVDKAIKDSLNVVESAFNNNRIEIITAIDKEFICNGYSNELQHVLVVILNNAREALTNRKRSNPKIIINIQKKDEYFIIKICDNAGGIDDEIVEKIFEPYFTTKHKSQGIGLGLYFSKMIMEKSLEGKLTVNRIDDGSCFEIIFPQGEI